VILLSLTLAGILTTQPVDRVYLAGNWFAYSIGNTEFDCSGAKVSLTGERATVTADRCGAGLFQNNFEVQK
jgi:hypothetical protein